jgi:hypothetical protein
MNENAPFTVALDANGKWYVKCGRAPGCEFAYHGGYLAPSSRYENEDQAAAAARVANQAYQLGLAEARRMMREALGIWT